MIDPDEEHDASLDEFLGYSNSDSDEQTKERQIVVRKPEPPALPVREVKSLAEPDLMARPVPQTLNVRLAARLAAIFGANTERTAARTGEITRYIKTNLVLGRERFPVKRDPATRGERWDQDAKQARASLVLLRANPSTPTDTSKPKLIAKVVKSSFLSRVFGRLTN